MISILVVEDNDRLFEGYLERMLGRSLEKEGIEEYQVQRASNLEGALSLLVEENPNVILMDFDLGKRFFCSTPEGPIVLTNGADLIGLRRALEQDERRSPSRIIGMASHPAGNLFLGKSGADVTFLKLDIPQMARQIREWL